MSEQVKDLTVQQLFEAGRYVIPLYQRNYAWGEEEVSQLIHDIWDSYQAGSEKPYYIGSLVVAKRNDGKFEVVDGQQRHTTLSILLAYLKSKGEEVGNITQTNLEFECRELSTQTLHDLFQEKGKTKDGENAMLVAFDTCDKAFKEGSGEKIDDVKKFTEYLLDHVIILRTEVPEDTDLNHYFEIMNNRGEQLEKHEVLKARFLHALKSDKPKTAAFAKVWDACADMNRYVVMGFEADARKELFGDDLSEYPKNFDDIVSKCKASVDGGGGDTLENLLTGIPTIENEKKDKPQPDESFTSIIDFPNFLLHVLRVSGLNNLRKIDLKENYVILDDKKLLDEFADEPTPEDAKEFITALLKARFLFDRYIIKREHDKDPESKWCLNRRKRYDTSSSENYVRTFEDRSLNKQLVMVQSMFHVSYPTRNYKYWLNDALAYLCKSDTDLSGKALLTHFETLSDRFFFDRFAANEAQDYDDILKNESVNSSIEPGLSKNLRYDQGIHTFVFNRLDYLLWKQAKSPVKTQTGIEYSDKIKASSFTFTFKSSIEHVSPQTDDEDNTEENRVLKGVLHRFGNLALVSASFNSSASNKTFKEKKEAFNGKKKPESLKLALIYQYESWGDDEAKAHEEQMIEVLCAKQPYAS